MGRTIPYASARVVVSETTYRPVLRFERAWTMTAMGVRLTGQGVYWRLMASGLCGAEELASGSIPSGLDAMVRLGTLPTTLACATLSLEVALTAAGAARSVSAEATWIPADPTMGPAEPG